VFLRSFLLGFGLARILYRVLIFDKTIGIIRVPNPKDLNSHVQSSREVNVIEELNIYMTTR